MPDSPIPSECKSVSVSVEKIENGYITRKSEWDGNGGYSSTETYSKEAPSIGVEATPRPRNVGTLRSAIKSMK